MDRNERIDSDLSHIRSVFFEGLIDEATQKLAVVSSAFPPGSPHSKEIGDLFWELNFPAMAGRYWYFLNDKSDRMRSACIEFERSLGNNPILIYESFLKSPVVSSSEVESKLKELKNRAIELYDQIKNPLRKSRGDRLALLGCGILTFMFLFVFFVGVLSIYQWYR
jgi:hypothetical protein